MQAVLVLEDGRTFRGNSLGRPGMTWGEVVFNTSMTGYQEILTDPAYRGQLVTLTYPLIGNYGLNGLRQESYTAHLDGLIIKEPCSRPSHWRSEESLSNFLNRQKVCGISGIDTRSLTRHIREKGSMTGVITTESQSVSYLQQLAIGKGKDNRNLVKEVSLQQTTRIPGSGPRIVVMDFGVKYNILRSLREYGAELIIVPWNTTADEIISYHPDGILLSSGPGDPRDLGLVVDEVKLLIGHFPIFGICLGHQLLGMAWGGNIYKMKFGHHGGNHPVKDLTTGRIVVTTQNHGYALEDNGLKDVVVTHRNLNDETVEGIRHKSLPVFSLQYHPEAGPGPVDSLPVFSDFINQLGQSQNRQKKIVNF